jgi:hypothetical protein
MARDTEQAGWGTNGWPVVVSRPTPAAEPQAEDTTPTEQQAQAANVDWADEYGVPAPVADPTEQQAQGAEVRRG